jgi:uncharacterized membrane protein YqjE
MEHQPTLFQTIKAIMADARLLAREEIELAKAEASEKIDRIQNGIVMLVAGLAIGIAALVILSQAVVMALAAVMTPLVATLVTGGILALIALITLASGQSQMSADSLKMQRTEDSLKHSAQTLKG